MNDHPSRPAQREPVRTILANMAMLLPPKRMEIDGVMREYHDPRAATHLLDLREMFDQLLAALAALAAPVQVDGVDQIVSQLYRRFKDWHKRGFGPDDVTWCEVKADVTKLISAALAAPLQDGVREAVADIIAPGARQSLEREQDWCKKHNKPESGWCDGVRRRYDEALTKADAIFATLSQGASEQVELGPVTVNEYEDACCQVERPPQPRWRHKKRGSTYTEICRAELQADRDVIEGFTMIVYRCDDGKYWVRWEEEFEDGRFEALPVIKGERRE